MRGTALRTDLIDPASISWTELGLVWAGVGLLAIGCWIYVRRCRRRTPEGPPTRTSANTETTETREVDGE